MFPLVLISAAVLSSPALKGKSLFIFFIFFFAAAAAAASYYVASCYAAQADVYTCERESDENFSRTVRLK